MKRHAISCIALCIVGAAACILEEKPYAEKTFDKAAAPIQGGRIENGYPSVGLLEFESGNFGTGTLIAPRVVVTAAHVAFGKIKAFYTGDGVAIPRGKDNTASSTMRSWPIAGRAVHPSYPCAQRQPDAAAPVLGDASLPIDDETCAPWFDGGRDIALILLDAPAEGLTPMKLGPAPEVGARCETVGYGDHVDDWDAASPLALVKRKRSATNIVSQVESFELETTAVDGIADSGDSGGPLFCGGLLVATTAYHLDTDGPAHRKEWYMRTDAVEPWMRAQFAAWNQAWPADSTVDADAGAAADSATSSTASRSTKSDGCNSRGDVKYGWGSMLVAGALGGLALRRRRGGKSYLLSA